MRFDSKVIALLSTLYSITSAADVFSHFADSSGAQIGSTQFDVSDGGCFTAAGATQVSFTQDSNSGKASGPYCLTGFAQGSCGGTATTQQFQDIEINDDHKYELNTGLDIAGSYRWSASGC